MAKVTKPEMIPVTDEFHKPSAMQLALKKMREKQIRKLRIEIGEENFQKLVTLLTRSHIKVIDPSK